jgi:UDP:flavonoid glycosyltransferase YjiC (YdhE family)
VRVLFSTTAGSGHFGPMAPFATACRDAGHEVKVAAPASFGKAVAATGLDHAPFADVPLEVLGPIFGRLPELSRVEANRTVIAEVFGRLDAQAALPGLTEIMANWRPDVVVRELCEFGSLVAAAQAGIPQVEVAIGLAATVAFALPIVESPLAELDGIAGLPVGTASRTLASGPILSCIPVELDGDVETDGFRVRRFRDASLTAEQGPPPPPWGDPGHPLVYVTFGSVAAGLPPFAGVYRSVLDALAGEPFRVLMTTGSAVEPGSLAPLPANARVEQWWPQAAVMPHTDVVVGHGGFGTTMTALAGGVPQVVIPLFAFDQFVNAERVAAIGAGVCLDGGPDAVSALATALADVLDGATYAEKARRVAAAMAELPDVASSVSFLEELAGLTPSPGDLHPSMRQT